MTRNMQRTLAALLASAGALGLAGLGAGAFAAESAHDHGDAHATAKPLPAGKRWQTDAPLREGMGQIRDAYAAQLPLIHQNKLTPEQYKELAGRTEAQVGNVVANCKLPPDADAALHGILAQIGEGTDAMAGKSKMKPRDGALQVVAALGRYEKTFDHPGWKRLPD